MRKVGQRVECCGVVWCPLPLICSIVVITEVWSVDEQWPVMQRGSSNLSRATVTELLAVMYVEIDDWYVFVWMTGPIRNGRSFGQRVYGRLAVVLQ